MRYLVFLSLCALALYAATAEDIYKIYKTKGINAVEDFLKKEFSEISLDKLGLDTIITETLNLRFEEIKICLNNKAPLSVIFLSGSIGVFFEPVEVFNKAIVVAILITALSLQSLQLQLVFDLYC